MCTAAEGYCIDIGIGEVAVLESSEWSQDWAESYFIKSIRAPSFIFHPKQPARNHMSHITKSILLQLHAATECALRVAQAVLQTETEFEWGKLISDLSQNCTGRGAAPLSLVLWDSYFEGRPNSRKETFFLAW